MSLYATIEVLLQLRKFIHFLLLRPAARALFVILLPVILGGVFFYHHVENMSWIDAFYFSIVTLTTVGYGDLAPETTGGKLFTVVYIVLGIGLFAAFFTELAQAIIEDRKQGDEECESPRTDDGVTSR